MYGLIYMEGPFKTLWIGNDVEELAKNLGRQCEGGFFTKQPFFELVRLPVPRLLDDLELDQKACVFIKFFRFSQETVRR